jgi:hypothetical protein
MHDRPDAVGRFGALLRHYWLICTATFVLVVSAAVGGWVLLAGQGDYEAYTLIVPRTLGDDLDALRLSRFQQAVFENGGVIEASLADADVPYEDRAELLEQVQLAPVVDNIALNVAATDPDPVAAAEIANVVAGNLVEALNRTGPSGGVFLVHTEATPPSIPDAELSLVSLIAVGVFAGIAAAAGLAIGLGALRRPVLSVDDAVEPFDCPSLGRLRLPSARDEVPLARILGLSAMVRRIYPERRGTCVFVAPEGSQVAKRQVASLVARALERSGPTVYVTSAAGHEPEEPAAGRIERQAVLRVGVADRATVPTVVEGPADASEDLPQTLPADASIVVVVAKGERAARLDRVRQQFLPGDVLGVLFVDAVDRPRRRRRGQPRRHRDARPETVPTSSLSPPRADEGAGIRP